MFDPEGVVTREQMAAFLTRALDEVPADGYCGTEDPFTDVAYDWWSCKYVKRLVELGITLGIGEGLYGPGKSGNPSPDGGFLGKSVSGDVGEKGRVRNGPAFFCLFFLLYEAAETAEKSIKRSFLILP